MERNFQETQMDRLTTFSKTLVGLTLGQTISYAIKFTCWRFSCNKIYEL